MASPSSENRVLIKSQFLSFYSDVFWRTSPYLLGPQNRGGAAFRGCFRASGEAFPGPDPSPAVLPAGMSALRRPRPKGKDGSPRSLPLYWSSKNCRQWAFISQRRLAATSSEQRPACWQQAMSVESHAQIDFEDTLLAFPLLRMVESS